MNEIEDIDWRMIKSFTGEKPPFIVSLRLAYKIYKMRGDEMR